MKKILVIDDDQDILDAVQSILALEGFAVDTSLSGNEVLNHLETTQPDVILMDIMIAGVDGREICKQLKGHPEFEHIPVILFSASDLTFSDVVTCGANDFMPKPFDLDRLISIIQKHAAA